VCLYNVFVESAIEISKGTFLRLKCRVFSVATCIRIVRCGVGSYRKPELAGPALAVRNLYVLVCPILVVVPKCVGIQECVKPVYQFAMTAKLYMVAPNTCL
jgi:hypothetical protein